MPTTKSTIDYDALAKQAGSIGSERTAPPVDYDALAKQAGSIGSEPTSRSAIDYTHVAGAEQTGVPGQPLVPNPINKFNPYVSAPLSATAQLDKQIGTAAWDSAKGAYQDAVQGFKNFKAHPLASIWRGGINTSVGPLGNVLSAGMDVYSGHPEHAVSRLLSGNPEQAEKDKAAGNEGGYLWNMYGMPLAMAGASELGARALGVGGDIFRGERFANNNFANIIAPGFKQGELPYEAAERLRPYYQQEAAAMGLKDEGWLGRNFTGAMPSRNTPGGPAIPETVKGMQKARDIADRVVDRIDARVNGPDGVMAQAKKDPIPPATKQRIIDDLENQRQLAAKLNSKGLAEAFESVIKLVKNANTYGDMNAIKQDANKMIEGVLNGKSVSEKGAASIEPIMAWREAGNSIRANMYPDLQNYVAPQGTPGYFNIADTGRLEAQAMDARDGIYSSYYQSGMQNLPEVSKRYLEKVAGGSLYKTHIIRRALDLFPTPAGQFNLNFRRGLGKIGEGAEPESLEVKKQQLKLPPPAPEVPALSSGESIAVNPYFLLDHALRQNPEMAVSGSASALEEYPGTFNVGPTQIPHETVVGQQSTPKALYLGTREVPNPNYTPITGPSYAQQERELGSTAGTIPNSVRGERSPARVRADQIGIGHIPPPPGGGPPLRSITGPETTTATNWQYLTSAKEPELQVTRNGAAVMTTRDPMIADKVRQQLQESFESEEKNIKQMQEFRETRAYKDLPPEERRLHDAELENRKKEQVIRENALTNLNQQWDEYQKWKAKNPSPQPPYKVPEFEVWRMPGKPGKVSNKWRTIRHRAEVNYGRAGVVDALRGNEGTSADQNTKTIQQEEEEEQRLMGQPQ